DDGGGGSRCPLSPELPETARSGRRDGRRKAGEQEQPESRALSGAQRRLRLGRTGVLRGGFSGDAFSVRGFGTEAMERIDPRFQTNRNDVQRTPGPVAFCGRLL